MEGVSAKKNKGTAGSVAKKILRGRGHSRVSAKKKKKNKRQQGDYPSGEIPPPAKAGGRQVNATDRLTIQKYAQTTWPAIAQFHARIELN